MRSDQHRQQFLLHVQFVPLKVLLESLHGGPDFVPGISDPLSSACRTSTLCLHCNRSASCCGPVTRIGVEVTEPQGCRAPYVLAYGLRGAPWNVRHERGAPHGLGSCRNSTIHPNGSCYCSPTPSCFPCPQYSRAILDPGIANPYNRTRYRGSQITRRTR